MKFSIHRIWFLFVFMLFFSLKAVAIESENYILSDYVFNAGGTTQTATSGKALSSIGEALVGQMWGSVTSVQTGFFNDYFIAQPTPTVTPTVTVTITPIRTFGGELLDEKWVYAAPNPVRGHIANICYDLAETADVEIKVFTTGNQLVISKRWDNAGAGKNAWQWNVSNLANGIYIVRIKATNTNRTTVVKKKIAIVK